MRKKKNYDIIKLLKKLKSDRFVNFFIIWYNLCRNSKEKSMKKKAIVIITGSEKEKQEVDLEIKNEKLNYREKDGTNVFFNQKEKVLIRENEKFFMEFFFEKEIISIYMKEERKNIEIPIIMDQLEINDNRIKIIYRIENQEYCYEIRMEELS